MAHVYYVIMLEQTISKDWKQLKALTQIRENTNSNHCAELYKPQDYWGKEGVAR